MAQCIRRHDINETGRPGTRHERNPTVIRREFALPEAVLRMTDDITAEAGCKVQKANMCLRKHDVEQPLGVERPTRGYPATLTESPLGAVAAFGVEGHRIDGPFLAF